MVSSDSELREKELHELEQEIEQARSNLARNKADAREKLRRTRLVKTGFALGALISFGLAWGILGEVLSTPFLPGWRWMGGATALLGLGLTLFLARQSRPVVGLDRWLARIDAEIKRCEAILRDDGFNIHLLQSRADLLRSRLAEETSAPSDGATLSSPTIEHVDPRELVPSPEKTPLPRELHQRVVALQQGLAEVYGLSLAEWLDGFERDANPAAEIVWWEKLARAYRSFLQSGLTSQQKELAFNLAFKVALGMPKDSLTEELAGLPPDSYEVMTASLRVF